MSVHSTRSVDGLGSATIVVVFLLGTAVAGLLALNLRRQQSVEIGFENLQRAQSLARVAEVEVDRLYANLQRRASFGIELADQDRIPLLLQVFMEENPSVLAITSPTSVGRRAVNDEADAVLSEWLATDPEIDTVLGPAELGSGHHVLGVNLRAPYGTTDVGAIFAVFEPKRLLSDLFAEVAGNYAYVLHVNGAPVWTNGGGDAPGDSAQFASQVLINRRVGEPWTLEVWPTPAAIPDSHLYGPLFVLTAGVTASGLIAAVLHFGTIAWRRARILDETYGALEQHVDDSIRSQQAQQRLSEELEARVSERTAELNETIAELQTFNYSVSHDLRSPLAAIINFSGIFTEDYAGRLDDVQIGYLDRISASARAAVDLMDALMSYSHSGRTELRPVKLNVRRLVHELTDEVKAAWPERSCGITVGELPDCFADETMLRFIFANLISNACKFVRPGENPSVEVGGQREATENVYFVRDEGVGFDSRFEQKLFKAFERLHRSTEYPGHGIGLAIVARMVRRHGGRVWAQGAVDKGATFYFSIPRRWENGDDAAAA